MSSAPVAFLDVVKGRYYDSVRLLQVSRDVGSVPGVEDALVAMGTPLNVRLLERMGFGGAPDVDPDDLVIAVSAVDDAALDAARAAIEHALSSAGAAVSEMPYNPPPHRTLVATGRDVSANLALISVPGQFAFVEAMDALRHGMHVMVFSDNVTVEQEVMLKEEGAARGLLVMGPDCGTSIVNGAGLGFANALDPGPVGICGASGTGIQQLCCLLDAAGVGVRHALGTGSRDLSAAVGGASTVAALAALDADPVVEVIIVVSKPPDPVIAAAVREAVSSCSTPIVEALLDDADTTLEGAASAAVATLGRDMPPLPVWRPERVPQPRRGSLVGNFSGGTLRDEAGVVAARALGPIGVDMTALGHRLVDFGADQFTQGRAHPMIDPTLRIDGFRAATADAATGVILADVVLGYGAHPDPAAELAPHVAAAIDADIPVVVSLCGTRGDPQGRDTQAMALQQAGAEVYLSNAAAAVRAVALVTEGSV